MMEEIEYNSHKDLTLTAKINKILLEDDAIVFCPPFVAQKTCTMLYSPRGVGKSHFAFNLALAMAQGSRWLGVECRKSKVIYIDGEMGAHTWVERLPQEMVLDKDSENLVLVNPEDYKNNMIPSLADDSLGDYWEQFLDPYEVVIIDNYLTTVYPKTNKDSELSLWYQFLRLLLNLKAKNKAIVIVHHTSKGGVQYGSILKENQMDTIIRLRQFPQQCLENGLTWEVKIEKDRNNFFDKKLEFAMDIIFTDQKVYTNKKDIRELRKSLIEQYILQGLVKAEIASILNCETFEIAEMYNQVSYQLKDKLKENLW